MPVAKKFLGKYLETEALIMGFFGAALFGSCNLRLIFELVVTLTDSCNYIEPFAQEHFMERCIPTEVLLVLLTICVTNFTAYALFIRGIAKNVHKLIIPLIVMLSLQTLLTALDLLFEIVIKLWIGNWNYKTIENYETLFTYFSLIAFPLSVLFLIISVLMYKRIASENS